jgi:antitoxin VapB
MNVDLTISRHGDVIMIAPARKSMKEVVAALRAMPKPPAAEAREPIEMPDRAWD